MCVSVCACVCVCVCLSVCANVCVCVCVCAFNIRHPSKIVSHLTLVRDDSFKYACVIVYSYVYLCACICVYIHIYTHTCIYMYRIGLACAMTCSKYVHDAFEMCKLAYMNMSVGVDTCITRSSFLRYCIASLYIKGDEPHFFTYLYTYLSLYIYVYTYVCV